MRIRAKYNIACHHGAESWDLEAGGVYDLPEEVSLRLVGETLAEAVDPPLPVGPAVEAAPDKALHEGTSKRKSRRK